MTALDKSHIDQVERLIRPPFEAVITLPVTGKGMEGYAIYIAASAFSCGHKPYAEVERNLKTIAANLTLNL